MTAEAASAEVTGTDNRYIDTFVQCDWTDDVELREFFPDEWKDYIGTPGTLPMGLGAKTIGVAFPYYSLTRDRVDPGDWGVATVTGRLRADDDMIAGIVSCTRGSYSSADNNPRFAHEVCAAVNRWLADRVEHVGDRRLRMSVIAPNQDPDAAARMIGQYAGNSHAAQVTMGGNGLNKPFGHPIYHPIYRAAADAGMPVMICAGGDALADTLTHPTAGGVPTGSAEYEVLGAHALMTHLVSLITQGVFERFPALRVIVQGAGAGWIPSFLLRLELNYKAFGRDVPWMKRRPVDYFADHIRVGTFPLMMAPAGIDAEKMLAQMPWLGDVICYGTGTPDSDDGRVAFDSTIPGAWHERILRDNAATLFAARL